jgi:hypothetical protein
MKIPAAVFLSLSLAAAVAAEEAVDLPAVGNIREEGLAHSKVMETLAHLTDVIGPRVTGSPQMKQANDWTREQLAAWGLANAHLEPWAFGRGWSLERSSVHMVAPTSTPLIALPRGWTPGTDGVRRGAVMKVKIESEADLEQYRGKVEGKVLLLNEAREMKTPQKSDFERFSEDELAQLSQFDVVSAPRRPFDRESLARRFRLAPILRKFLETEKALATVEVSSSDAGIVNVGRGGSWRKGESVGVPSLVMAAEHYNRIVRLVDRGIPVELELDVKSTFHEGDGMAYNTIAEIPGSEKKGELVMIGAHLDSWHAATGATDNAAGVAIAMEAMRILQALDQKPRRTIRIGLWSGEEIGLLGSRAYVAEHFGSRGGPENPEEPRFLRPATGPVTVKPGHAKLSAYFNVDNGTGKIRGIYAEKNVAVAPIFEAWLSPLRDLGATTVTLRTTRGTDHEAFDQIGLPGFQFIQDEADYSTRTHHTNLDVYDRAQKADLMQASVVLATFAWQAANRDGMLPRKSMPRGEPARTPSPAPSPVASSAPARSTR